MQGWVFVLLSLCGATGDGPHTGGPSQRRLLTNAVTGQVQVDQGHTSQRLGNWGFIPNQVRVSARSVLQLIISRERRMDEADRNVLGYWCLR